MGKKLFSWMLTICMLLTMMPTMAWAEGEVPPVEPTETPVVEQPEQQPAPADEEPVLMMSPAPVAETETLPVGTLDISKGSILITDTGYAQGIHKFTDRAGYSIVDDEGNPVTETTYAGEITIIGENVATSEASRYVIMVEGAGQTITLNNVTSKNNDADSGSKVPAFVLMSGTATLKLEGTNVLVGTPQSPAVQINRDATLTITATGTGSLDASTSNNTVAIGAPRGGNSYNEFSINSAGRREDTYSHGGNLIIESGIINAFGAGAGAGIGASHSSKFGNITINGGSVTVNSEFNGICTSTNSDGGGDITIAGGDVNVTINKANNNANGKYAAIGGGKDGKTCSGDVTISGGKITIELKKEGAYAINTGGDFLMTGGTLAEIKGTPIAYIGNSSVSITGGNINSYYAEDIDGYTLSNLYFVNANGTAVANSEVTVGTWKAYTNSDGIITTYVANNGSIADAQKLPDGWLIGGTCVCATAPLTFEDMVDEVDVYSVEKAIDVVVRGECKMPIHQNVTTTVKIDSVTLENGAKVEKSSVADYAVYDSDAKKLTLKPAGNTDNYTVKLYALRSIEDDLVYHEIKVWASNTVGRKLDVANGAITVEEASEAGKVTYKQGDNEFTVGAADNVIITGTSSENNIEVSTDATIVLKDLSLTDIKAKSPIKLTNNATLNLWLEGENTLTTGNYNHNEGEGGTVVSGVTTAAIFVESGSTLIIDSEVGTLKNDDIDTAHYGDKQTGYKGSLFAKIGASRGGASAIGGDLFASPDMACGNITIKGGNVTAQATMASNKHLSGSAIGSGYAAGDGSVVAIKQCGDVTISGGNVRALVADGANTPSRAISSGVGNLTITGGVIYASAPNDGWNGDSAGSIATFTGTLTIGETNGDDSDLYIYAATTTTNVTGSDQAAPAIGVGSGGTLNVLSGTITAESTGNGPAIGVAPYAPVTDEPVVLNIAGGTIGLVLVDETQAGTAAAMGIGGNNYDNAVEINISGGTIESNDLNIGVRGNAESTVNISGDAVVKIGNGNIVGDVTVGEGATLSTNEEKEIKGDVTVKGGATINGTTLPEDVGSITVSGDKVNEVAVTDGTVTLPAGSTVTKEDGTSVELSAGGTLAADGAITAGGTVTTKDAQGNVVSTVVVPEGKDATVAADGTVTAPAGTKVTVGDKETTLTNGGTVSADGTVKKNYAGGGWGGTTTPTVTPSVDKGSLNNAAQAVGNAINNGSAELEPTSGYTKEDIAKLQKEGKLNLTIEKKSGYASVADKNAIDAAIKKAGGAVSGTSVLYFDITPVLKTDDGKVVASVTDTEKPISITIDLSADLQKAAKDGKHIAVVRCHEGKVTFLDTKLNAAKTQVTFSSSDFSTYAVVAMEKQTSAQTFDAGIVVYAGMAVLAATGSAVVIGKKRRAE